jgi:hypothetical protein
MATMEGLREIVKEGYKKWAEENEKNAGKLRAISETAKEMTEEEVKQYYEELQFKYFTASFLKTSLNMYEKMQEETQENIQNEE